MIIQTDYLPHSGLLQQHRGNIRESNITMLQAANGHHWIYKFTEYIHAHGFSGQSFDMLT